MSNQNYAQRIQILLYDTIILHYERKYRKKISTFNSMMRLDCAVNMTHKFIVPPMHTCTQFHDLIHWCEIINENKEKPTEIRFDTQKA